MFSVFKKKVSKKFNVGVVFFSTDNKSFVKNFYGDSLSDINKKVVYYYSFENTLKSISLFNSSVPKSYFSLVPTPFFYFIFPFSFFDFLQNLKSSNKFLYYFINFFGKNFNISPFVSELFPFSIRTFNGFSAVSIWYNFHFFLPFCFSYFSSYEIKGTFYDISNVFIISFRQKFCSYFFRRFANSTSFFKFFFIQFFIFTIPFFFIFFIFFLRDKITLKNPFYGISTYFKTNYFVFEFWNPINYYWYRLYSNYIFSFVFFCSLPKNIFFSFSPIFIYPHISNRIYFFSFKKIISYVFSYFSFLIIFFINFFGFYHIRQFSTIKDDIFFSSYKNKSFNGEHYFLFKAYLNNLNVCSTQTNKIIKYFYGSSNFYFKNNNLFEVEISSIYKNSIFHWPKISFFQIDKEIRFIYKDYHFSKFNTEFEFDNSKFPFIDPDFVHIYSKELLKNIEFRNNFSSYDVNRLYSFYSWKVAKDNKFKNSEIWNIFYNKVVSKDGSFTFTPSRFFQVFITNNENRVSFIYTYFGIIFFFQFSVFYPFFKFFYSFYLFIYFLFSFFFFLFKFNLFFIKFFSFFSKLMEFIYFFYFFYKSFFYKSFFWVFDPIFIHFKNFFINFYSFFKSINLIRNFYVERSINKTVFLETIEEIEDEETHFTEDVEQSHYKYWYQDFEINIDLLSFIYDEVYDQFTDLFSYEDDGDDFINSIYSSEDFVNISHNDIEISGYENYRDSDNYSSDEIDQEDFEDSYDDLEFFFSPIEESLSNNIDYLFLSIFFINDLIYDSSDLIRSIPKEKYIHSHGHFHSMEYFNSSYDEFSTNWRPYFYNFWGSNVPINADYQLHINSQLKRYSNYIDKWYNSQISSGKYIKVPNIIRADISDVFSFENNFSLKDFKILTIYVNNVFFPNSKISKIYSNYQIDTVWRKVSNLYQNDPNYAISIINKSKVSEKIFHIISKNNFSFKEKNRKSFLKFFYFFEKISRKIFYFFYNFSTISKYNKTFINNFFSQNHLDFDKDFNNISHSTIEELQLILKNISINNINPSNDYLILNNNFKKTNFSFVKISLFKIIMSLIIIKFIRRIDIIKTKSENLPDSSVYLYILSIFSSLHFINLRTYYIAIIYIIKIYSSYHKNTGNFYLFVDKRKIYNDILSFEVHNNILESFNVLSDLGLYWKDLLPNLNSIYKKWNDPFISSLFFPEQFYTILTYSDISNFDDEEVDMYEEYIYFETELGTADYNDEPFDIDSGVIFEDNDADTEEEYFFRSESFINTVLYEDLSEDDDEFFDSEIYWYEQIEDEPEYDEWDFDFFDEIEDINIPIQRIFFGDYYRNFLNSKQEYSKKNVKNETTFDGSFYSSFISEDNKKFILRHDFSKSSELSVPKIYDNNDSYFYNKSKVTKNFTFSFFYNLIFRIIKFFFYFWINFKYILFSYAVDVSCSIRKPLSIEERKSIVYHYSKFKHLYNSDYFFEFKKFINQWIKNYKTFNSKDNLNQTIFELIRSNLKLDHSHNSPLKNSPFSFSWFEEPSITKDFKWEVDEVFNKYFDYHEFKKFKITEQFTTLINDFVKDFLNSDEIIRIKDQDEKLFKDSYNYGLFLISSFFLQYEFEIETEKFSYIHLIYFFLINKKKNVLHSDLYTQDIYKIFEDDWSSIQNQIGLYKEDSSAWLNPSDNAPEDDLIEDPVSPFYICEEEILHSSQEYSSKFFIILDAIWEYICLITDYNIYWIRLIFKVYIISYFRGISAYHDKKWNELFIKYGIIVYFFRYFFSFSFIVVFSLYVVFIVPRIIFIYTLSSFKLFFSLFFSGVICFIIIFFVLLMTFHGIYNSYKDINEYEKNSFFFGAFISWFSIVWYNIINTEIWELDATSINLIPSVDPDPIFSPDYSTLEFLTPEVTDFDPQWFYSERSSIKSLVAPQPITFGYFLDIFFSQYLNVSHRSLTGHRYREKFEYLDGSTTNQLVSDSIQTYIKFVRHHQNSIINDRNISISEAISKSSKLNSSTKTFNTKKKPFTANFKNDKINIKSNYSSKYYSKFSSQILKKYDKYVGTKFSTLLPLDIQWYGEDPLYSYKDLDFIFQNEKFYKGRNIYSSITNNSKHYIRNYYDDSSGDDEIQIWNVHFRPYDWFNSSYISSGFYKSIRKYRPFNFSNIDSYLNSFKVSNFSSKEIKYIDYFLPSKLYFSQYFSYGFNKFYYDIFKIENSYKSSSISYDNFNRFYENKPFYEYYIYNLTTETNKFNYLKTFSYKSKLKYFYINRYKYYISKFNPYSRLFYRVNFDNIGGWPVINKSSNFFDIYISDYPLFIESIKYNIFDIDERFVNIRKEYYKRNPIPSFSFYNFDFFNWVFYKFKFIFFFDSSFSNFFDKSIFFFKKILIILFFDDVIIKKEKLFNLEKEFIAKKNMIKYSYYWNNFWDRTNSSTFDFNPVSLPSSALIINPNYLPSNYLNILSIKRYYNDSMDFYNRIFSRKRFKRFWYRSSFVPILDENPIRFSEIFYNFKVYESGIPISPSFSKSISDPVSKILKRGNRKPVFNSFYQDYLITKYYKSLINKYFNNDNNTKIFSKGQLINDKAFYNTGRPIEFLFSSFFSDRNKVFYSTFCDIFNDRFNTFQSNVPKNKPIINKDYYNDKIFLLKVLYAKNLITHFKIKNFYNDQFFEGKKSRFYFNQIYRYPHSKSISRNYYDLINFEYYYKNNIFPSSGSFELFFNNSNSFYYNYYKNNNYDFNFYQISDKIYSYSDRHTCVTDYFRSKFEKSAKKKSSDKININNFKKDLNFGSLKQDYYVIYIFSKFNWSGRHINAFSYDKYFSFFGTQNFDFISPFSKSIVFNIFPFIDLSNELSFRPNVIDKKNSSSNSSENSNRFNDNKNQNSESFSNIFIKLSEIFSNLSSDESKHILHYFSEYSWPGTDLLLEEFNLEYPYNSFSTVFYNSSSSTVFNDNNNYDFHSGTWDHLSPPKSFVKIFDKDFKDFKFLKSTIISGTDRKTRTTINLSGPLTKFNLIKNFNISIFEPIDTFFISFYKESDIINFENSNILKEIKQNRQTFSHGEYSYDYYYDKFKIIKSPNTYSQNNKENSINDNNNNNFDPSTNISVNSVSDIVQEKIRFFKKNDYIMKYFSTLINPSFSNYHSKNFQKKETFFESFLNDINSSKFQYSFYNNIRNFSNFEIYFYRSFCYDFSFFESHNFNSFSENSKKIINFIENRRRIFRNRLIFRVQKYVLSRSFEKTYNRVFSSSRVPIIDVDPFEVLLFSSSTKFNQFEKWIGYNDSFDIFNSKSSNNKKSDITYSKSFENKFIPTYKLSNNNFDYKFIHVNISNLLSERLIKSRYKNPVFISDKSLNFYIKNKDLLKKRSKYFISPDFKSFFIHDSSTINYFKYIIYLENQKENQELNIINEIREKIIDIDKIYFAKKQIINKDLNKVKDNKKDKNLDFGL